MVWEKAQGGKDRKKKGTKKNNGNEIKTQRSFPCKIFFSHLIKILYLLLKYLVSGAETMFAVCLMLRV